MTIEAAYVEFARVVGGVLEAAEFVPAADLRIDPEALIEPSGAEDDVVSVASLEKVQTAPVRRILGRPEPRWVVERQCRVELLSYGPARSTRLEIDGRAVAALSSLAALSPNLAGACERVDLISVEDTPVPPNGASMLFTFTLRVRSGDPLGATP